MKPAALTNGAARSVPAQRRSVDLSGTVASLRERAGDGPGVLLLHSNSTDSSFFDVLFESPELSRYRLLALDFPGHGHSPPSQNPESAYSMRGLAKLVRELVRSEKLPDVFLVGHSLGGHVALEAAPGIEAARGLVLISAPPISPSSLPRAFAEDVTGGALFSEPLSPLQIEAFARALAGDNTSLTPRFMDAIKATHGRFRGVLGASVGSGAFVDEVSLVAQLAIPTLMVVGGRDPFVRQGYYDEIRLGRPWQGGRLTIESAGHCPHLDDSKKFIAALRNMLSS